MAENPTALMQQLHDEHAAALWGFCLHLTSDPVRAEDVAQETLLRAWQHYEVLDEARGSVRSWLFTVARNIVIDEWRSKRYQNERAVDQVPEPGDPVDQTDTLLQSWVVAEAITQLSPRAPRGAAGVLLPRPVGGRGLAPARRARGHGEEPDPLRPARPAARPGGDGGGRDDRRTAAGTSTRTAPTSSAPSPPRTGSPSSGTCPAAPTCAQLGARAGRAARPAGPGAGRDPRPRAAAARRCPTPCCPRWYAASAGRSAGATWVTGGLVAAAAAVAIGAVGVATLGDDDDTPPERRDVAHEPRPRPRPRRRC